MPKTTIKKISALEILDSRGIPTLHVKVELDSGAIAAASVPSGTSAGQNEAHELRDGDQSRFGGKGVLKAAKNVEEVIFPKIKGKNVLDLPKIDQLMLKLDGTANKSRLGANAILGVSQAVARAGAHALKTPLYQHLRKIFKLLFKDYRLPTPMFNLLNGGLHADSGMDVQEFMLVPSGVRYHEALRAACETFMQLQKILQVRKQPLGVGLEGGFAPALQHSREVIEVLLEATKQAGVPEGSAGIGLDVAASGLFDSEKDQRYVFRREKASFSRDQLIGWYSELVNSYPIVSIEDGLEENDWEGWRKLNEKLGDKIRIVGDDLTVTSPKRLKTAIEQKAINTIIVKPNQIGSLTETIETVKLAQKNKIKINVSHRSGDTNDPFIADLAVAVNAEFIKSGSVTRGERLAKYNRLLEIEKALEL